MIRALAGTIVRHRFWVIVLIVAATLALALQVRHLRIVIDPSAMLPKLHPNVIGTTLAENLFGSKYVVVVGVAAADGDTALRPDVLATVEHLTRELAQVPGVKPHTILSVTSDRARAISGTKNEMRVGPMLQTPITASAIEELKQHLSQNPVYQNTLVSRDGTLATVSFAVQIGPKGFREVMDKVELVLDKARSPEISVVSSGTAVFFAKVERLSARMAFLFPIALVLIGLVHLEAFRTKQGLILPLVTSLLAVIWSLGIMGAAGVSMDAFNATTPILILAVAAGHAVQVLKRYYEEYARLSELHPRDPIFALNDSAVVESLVKVAPVMIAAGLVAAMGLFSLLTFDIATIRTFGLFTGLGILCVLLIELTFIPALRSYLPAPAARAQRELDAQSENRFWDRLAKRITSWVQHRNRIVIFIFVCLGLLAVLAASHINRENSTKSYFGEGLQVRQDDRLLNDKLAGTNTLYVVFQGTHADQMKEPAVLRVIEDLQSYIATLPDVGKTISLVDFIKQMHRSMNGGSDKFYALADRQDLISQYLLLYSLSGQPTDFDAYIDYNYQNANLLVWMKNDSSKYAESMVTHIREYIQPRLPAGVTIQIGGSVPQTSALSETLVDGKLRNIEQMMLMVFIAGTIVFRSFIAGIYLILPLLFTVLVNFGLMGLTGIPLNTPNSVSSAMAVGIGADYAIYLLYRIREELQKTPDVDAALLQTMKTAGKAIVYVASAISVGYAVLMLSLNFYVHIWFGLLIVASMIVSATSALVLIPALIKLHTPRFLLPSTSNASKQAAQIPMGSFPRARSAGDLQTFTGAAICSACLVAAMMSTPLDAKADELQVQTLMESNYQSSRLDSSISHATFHLLSASGQERIRQTFGATKLSATSQGANRRIIRFLSPGDVRNTTTLLIENPGKEDEIWVYLPALKKARRLASSNKKNSFAGTDLSFGDLVGYKTHDWNHQLLRQETLAGAAVLVVESRPRTPQIANDTGYSKRISWVDSSTFVSHKVEFYDLNGILLKTVDNSQLVLVDAKRKKYQAMQVEVKNHQSGHATTLRFENFEANKPVAETYFSAAYLEKEE